MNTDSIPTAPTLTRAEIYAAYVAIASGDIAAALAIVAGDTGGAPTVALPGPIDNAPTVPCPKMPSRMRRVRHRRNTHARLAGMDKARIKSAPRSLRRAIEGCAAAPVACCAGKYFHTETCPRYQALPTWRDANGVAR